MSGLEQYIYHDEGKKMYFGRLSKKYQFDIDYEFILKEGSPTMAPSTAPPKPTTAPTAVPSEDLNIEKFLQE
jgi:hypothetical protein